MRIALLSFIVLLFSPLQKHFAQGFVDATVDQNIQHQYTGGEYGGGVCFFDFNRDGYDDITLCQSGTDVVVYVNNNGVFSGPISIAPNDGEAKSATWVDYDNDGDYDLFVTRKHGSWSLYRNDGDLFNLMDVTEEAGLPLTNFETYAASWADLNRDGHLDLYIANYNSDGVTNLIFISNGDGTFTEQTASSLANDGSWYSFLGFFLDYNQDRWPDLFVVNDRLEVSNHIYRNDSGSFTPVTQQLGLTDHFFSMNASTADYDHDGDLDLYVSNNPFGNRLYRQNDDLSYTNVAEELGVAVFDHSWSALWIDYDNDSFEDLHVACSPFWNQPGQNRFFKNNGDGTFTEQTSEAGLLTDKGWSHATAMGDFNNDGFADFFVVNDAPYFSKLWQALPTENNYLKIFLEGTASNRDGIGSWLHLFVNGDKLIRYTHIGEGYMTQNSATKLFGIGSAEFADSLHVLWPSGHTDRYNHLSANTTHHLIEGSGDSFELSATQYVLCNNESIELLPAIDGFYTWSNGETSTAPLTITEPGIYSCTVTNDYGVTISSNEIHIAAGTEPEIEIALLPPSCSGASDGVIVLSSPEELLDPIIQLNGLPAGWENTDLASGTYLFELLSANYCPKTIEIQLIDGPFFDALVVHDDILCYGTPVPAEVITFGGTLPVNVDWGTANPEELYAGEYTIQVIDNEGCYVELQLELQQPDELELSIQENSGSHFNALAIGGTPPYIYEWIEMDGTVTWGENVELLNGFQSCSVTDANNCTTTLEEVNASFYPIFGSRLEMTVHPNPTHGLTTVTNLPTAPLRFTLIDASGREAEIKLIQQHKHDATIDLSNLESGLYLLLITDQNKHLFTKRLIKR